MTGWMPGAPTCRIRACPRSAAEASNSALAPLWWKKVRSARPPARSYLSVNEVTASSQRPDAGHLDVQPRALGQDEGAVLVVADGAEHPDRKAAPSMRRSTAMLRPGPPVLSDTCSIVAR